MALRFRVGMRFGSSPLLGRQSIRLIAGPAGKTSWKYHSGTFALCSFVSLMTGAYAIKINQVFAILDEPEAALDLMFNYDYEQMTGIMDAIARSSSNNHVVQKLVSKEKYVARLLELTQVHAPAVCPAKEAAQLMSIRNHAMKIIENMCRHPEVRRELVARGTHKHIIRVMEDSRAGLFIKKTGGITLAYLAEDEQNHKELMAGGAIVALNNVQAHEQTQRHQSERALRTLCAAAINQGRRENQGDDEWRIVENIHARILADDGSMWASVKNPLVDSGLILYFHTMAGGATWGLITAIKDKMPRKQAVSAILRTSLITGLVPIYFVGGCVTLYNYMSARLETPEQGAGFYAGATMLTIYPWWYLMPIVEAAAPLWIGGHVVGFVSFFSYMMYSDADVLKADHQLQYLDRAIQSST